MEMSVAQKLGLAYFYSDYSIAGSVLYLNYLSQVRTCPSSSY